MTETDGAMTIIMSELDVQGRVQHMILQLAAKHACVHAHAVTELCSRTDHRDISRALQILIEEGFLEDSAAPGAPVDVLAVKGPLCLTTLGRLRLVEAA